MENNIEKTNNLGMHLLKQGQLNKDITLNEALLLIDSLLNSGLETLTEFTKPPLELEDGKLILTGMNPEESFSKVPQHIAFYQNGWHFLRPREGLTLWVKDIKKSVVFNGKDFQNLVSDKEATTPINDCSNERLERKLEELEKRINFIENPTKFGVNGVPDEVNKFVARSDYSLFNSEMGDVRLVLNKVQDVKTASFIFQSNWIGVAEFGVINGNNFIFKVAQNGIWKEVFEVDAGTGRLNFKQDVMKSGQKIF